MMAKVLLVLAALVAAACAQSCVVADVEQPLPWAGRTELETCCWYNQQSCCHSANGINGLMETFAQFGLRKGCYNNLVNALCASCAPNTEDFMAAVTNPTNTQLQTLTITYCTDWCNQAFQECFDNLRELNFNRRVVVDGPSFCKALPNALGFNTNDKGVTYQGASSNDITQCYRGVEDYTIIGHYDNDDDDDDDSSSPFGGLCVKEPVSERSFSDDDGSTFYDDDGADETVYYVPETVTAVSIDDDDYNDDDGNTTTETSVPSNGDDDDISLDGLLP